MVNKTLVAIIAFGAALLILGGIVLAIASGLLSGRP
jgi:hypothetical protein